MNKIELIDLPCEIITSHIAPFLDKSSIKSCSATCRLLCSYQKEMLYQYSKCFHYVSFKETTRGIESEGERTFKKFPVGSSYRTTSSYTSTY